MAITITEVEHDFIVKRVNKIMKVKRSRKYKDTIYEWDEYTLHIYLPKKMVKKKVYVVATDKDLIDILKKYGTVEEINSK